MRVTEKHSSLSWPADAAAPPPRGLPAPLHWTLESGHSAPGRRAVGLGVSAGHPVLMQMHSYN